MLVDGGEVTYGAEIFNDPGAVDAYRKPEAERTEGETQLIDQHHLASVQNGTNCRVPWPLRRFGRVRHRELETAAMRR